MKMSKSNLFRAGLPLLMLALTGCGRENVVYPDMPPEALIVPGASAAPPSQIDTRSNLPRGFFDHSVNMASVKLALDGVLHDSVALQLQTRAHVNAAGGFNGAGDGNRAILGNIDHDGIPLKTLGTVSFDFKSLLGSAALAVHMIVDLKCDGSALNVLIADEAAMAPGTAVSGGYTRYTAGFSQNKWRSSGADIMDPVNPAIKLLDDTSWDSLTALLAAYPGACLRNKSSGDPSHPKNVVTGAVLIMLGDEWTTDYNTMLINRVRVGDDIYVNSEWGF